MGAITDRIAELGVEIPSQAAAPAGVYVPAVVSGSYVYTAGQLPFVAGALPTTGKVGYFLVSLNGTTSEQSLPKAIVPNGAGAY